MAPASDFAIESLGEDALLLRFKGIADDANNRRVHALAQALQVQRPAWLRELVPAYASLALQVEADGLADHDAADPLAYARRWLETQVPAAASSVDASAPPAIEFPVCYGGTHGPDLEAVATHAGIDPDEVVARHAGADYRVAMLGFAPGFPYLLGLDPTLAMPRMDTPRTRVPAGSLGIGGAQTGIYPREGPGGWRLIGRTPLVLFDAARADPSLLHPGQRVRFVPIEATEFERLGAAARRRRPA
jgi:KipI family sensor histidine kinase inhibitor